MILVELDNKSTSVRMKAAKHPVSEELMVGPGENLFNFMADRLRDFMLEHNLLGEEKEHHLGFTFSFPTVQHSLASATSAGDKDSDTQQQRSGERSTADSPAKICQIPIAP